MMIMSLLAKCLVLSLSAVVLLLLSPGISTGASAMGLPPPQTPVNFTIGVQGMAWCKTCHYRGYYAPMDASPLPGAVAYLRCVRGRRGVSVRGVAGKGGYFLIQSAKMASFTSSDCRVVVRASPKRACGAAEFPAADLEGLPLKFERFLTLGDGIQALYSVGNFLFRPNSPGKCK
ncbi:uncharacterized protein LOC100838992 [Brachypodium distachyon]|uniref:Non-classical arabinogalactan protein 30 n=1 Tax=Brachypodium distachyon TaxID=15368 RepID=I1HH98_BRADI|nr:uncharacterized protein LOC100838992 [Brachypodium distachyon]KQK05238.1 hypothetical protein BRADI_2g18910v3 [Brachypodium distachyon]|eukprot:XP_003568037.1 uncharacterized protein LOC100838992 [Brachypodium distachyon]